MSERVRVLFVCLLVLLLVPRWAGEERLEYFTGQVTLHAEQVVLDPKHPALRQVGRLRFLGGVELRSDAPTFGGYSALLVEGDRFSLLGDRGNLLLFRMGNDLRPRDARAQPLPAGPGTGWNKWDRDSESLTRDRRSGQLWVGFEYHDQIWRYAPGFASAEARRAPPEMARWPDAGGAETMARLADGRFIVLSEYARPPRRRGAKRRQGRDALIFAGDPTDLRARAERFVYRPARGYHPVDVAALPDGRVLVLERRFDLPFGWSNRLAVVERGAIQPGATVAGRTIALLASPLIADNFEGLAVTREQGRTVLWLVSDDNQMWPQRTLLLKFGLDGGPPFQTAR